MLAMDVVDTLRHQDSLVTRELDETRREADLIDRLRGIYRGQGIDVPDRVLMEGVKALKESRFLYTPPKPGLARSLALLWVRRALYGRIVLSAVAAIGIMAGAWWFAIEAPRRDAAERTRVEIGTLLPTALQNGLAEVTAEARVPAARERAEAVARDGQAALARQDAAGARKAVSDLEALRNDLRREYEVRVVSRPNEPSGIWRIPDVNTRARNYYLVVEAFAPNGQKLSLPVKNEETGQTDTVDRWGVRVPEPVFEAIRRDKAEDGIVQNNRLGTKRRGELDVTWTTPLPGGAITRW